MLQTVQEGNLTGRAREELLRKYQEAWKVTPQHAHVHGLDMKGFYRSDPGAGFTRQARVAIYPDPEGVLKTTEVYDAMVAGGPF